MRPATTLEGQQTCQITVPKSPVKLQELPFAGLLPYSLNPRTYHTQMEGASLPDRVKELAQRQETLKMSRERLLVKREMLRSSRTRLRNKRVEVGDSEVILMNLLREYTHAANQSQRPIAIWEAYGKVEALRSTLGVWEDDHLQEEREVTGEEWKFMDQEAKFYQVELEDLFSPARPPPPPPAAPMYYPTVARPAPPPPPSPPMKLGTTAGFPITPIVAKITNQQVASKSDQTRATITAELKELESEFDRLRLQQAERAAFHDVDCEGTDVAGSEQSATSSLDQYSSELIQKIIVRRAELLRLKSISDDPTSALVISSVETSPHNNYGSVAHPLDPTHHSIENDSTGIRVQRYILQHLEENAIQRTLYADFLRQAGVDINTESWRDLITEYWSTESGSERAVEGIQERLTPR